MNSSMGFYLSSNSIREFILSLCHLSSQVFEISLNSSLVTDELSSQGDGLKSYAVYSEKMNAISNSLSATAKEMLINATRIMELSLEKTKYDGRIEKISEALELVREKGNYQLIKNALAELSEKTNPISSEASSVLNELKTELKDFSHDIKKLWMLSTNLKAQVEFDEIKYLTNISLKIEASLQDVDQIAFKLDKQLDQLERII